MIPIEAFVPHDKNVNTHPDNQIDLLARLIKFQGVRHPIIISNLSGKCVAGHGRFLAMKKCEMTTLPVVYQDFDDVHQELAFLVSDNKIQEIAETDEDLLNKLALELPDGFDLDLLGIPDFVIEPVKEFNGDEDSVPSVDESKVRTKLGDIYELGNHRLLCGDSTVKMLVEKLMNGEKADMVFTDPPYGMSLDTDYTTMDSGMGKNKNFKKVIGDNQDFSPSLIKTIFESFDYAKEIFLFGADYYAELIPNRNNGSWVIWDKSVTESMDRGFGSAWESCWSKAKHKRTFARILWRGLYGKKDDQKQRTHPTQKPVHLAEFFFENWGKETKSVADIYGGSGSTLIACEKTNRKCFMMELDPHYCDVIVSRWCKYTNKNQIKLNGQDITWTLDSTENNG